MAAPSSQQTRKYTVGEVVRGVAVAAGTTIASATIDIPLPAGVWRIGLIIDATNIATNNLSTIECVPISSLGVAGTAGTGYALITTGAAAATRVLTQAKVIYCEVANFGSLPAASVVIDATVVGGVPTGGIRLIVTKDVNTTGTYGVTYSAVKVG
jgi:hypothetical protein